MTWAGWIFKKKIKDPDHCGGDGEDSDPNLNRSVRPATRFNRLDMPIALVPIVIGKDRKHHSSSIYKTGSQTTCCGKYDDAGKAPNHVSNNSATMLHLAAYLICKPFGQSNACRRRGAHRHKPWAVPPDRHSQVRQWRSGVTPANVSPHVFHLKPCRGPPAPATSQNSARQGYRPGLPAPAPGPPRRLRDRSGCPPPPRERRACAIPAAAPAGRRR